MKNNHDPSSPHSHATRRAMVVIPTYNEKENVSQIISATLAEQASIGTFELHVLIADSHSNDGTLQIVEDLASADHRIHLLDVQERGIGVGLYKGFHHAIDELAADVLFEMDADFQHNPADIPRFLKKIDEGYDLVVGSRFAPGSVNRMPWYRRVLSVGANQVIRVMLNLQALTEITTSFRAFTKELFLKVDPDTVPWQERSFIFVPVFLVRMVEAGADATEIPMTMHPRVRGQSKMIYWKYIRDIMWFSIKSRFQK
ncbi:MAG: glycosyltransferase [Anaerolineae bacterium]|nr:glycosyltransferase [Anaerolineae bacterium]